MLIVPYNKLKGSDVQCPRIESDLWNANESDVLEIDGDGRMTRANQFKVWAEQFVGGTGNELRNLVLDGFDFSDWNVGDLGGHNLVFRRCSLRNCKFNNLTAGRMVYFIECNLYGADFTGAYPSSHMQHQGYGTLPLITGVCLHGIRGLTTRHIRDVINQTTDHTNDTRCAHCNEPLYTTPHHFNTFPYCGSCWDERFFTCDECGEAYSFTVNSQYAVNGLALCGTCFGNNYGQCIECRQNFELDSLQYSEEQGASYCARCRRPEPPRAIHSYGYKPAPTFHIATGEIKTPSTLFFGTEVEVEGPGRDHSSDDEDDEEYDDSDHDKHAAALQKDTTWCYCKTDGSLDNGFEIVSHPFSWAWFKENGEKVIKPRFKALTLAGYRSYATTTCGLHVHLARSAFNTVRITRDSAGAAMLRSRPGWDGKASPHLYRFCKFFYNNPDFVRFISRRRKDKLKMYGTPYSEPGRTSDGRVVGQDTLAVCAKGLNSNYERYKAVNLQGPKTAEVRIFRGTLDFEGYSRALEFCHSVFMFSRIAANGQLDYKELVKYVKAERKEYPNLHKFITERMPASTPELAVAGVED